MTPSVISAPKQMQLRWSTHHGTIIANFEALLKSESLVDVMLTADGKFIKAHKMLLSACSPYFEDMFKQMEGEKYPVVYLKDVKFTELEAIIHFMYHGEVKVSQEDLPSLLQVAKGLRIRGLSSDQPPPPPSSKLIPLQALMTSESTNSVNPAVTALTTSSSPILHSVSSGQFTNNSTAETPIRIVNCNSLATTSAASFQSFPVQISSSLSQTSVRPVTVGHVVRASTTLAPVAASSSPVADQFPAKPRISPQPKPSGGILIAPTGPSPTVQLKIAKQVPGSSKTRPIILGQKGTGIPFATPPTRSVGGPPILFPEVSTSELKPKFKYIKAKPRLSVAAPELEEEETEMMTSANEMSDDTHSNHELCSASWSYVEPEKLTGIKFSTPPGGSTSSEAGPRRILKHITISPLNHNIVTPHGGAGTMYPGTRSPRRRVGRPRARRGNFLKQRGRTGSQKNAPTPPIN